MIRKHSMVGRVRPAITATALFCAVTLFGGVFSSACSSSASTTKTQPAVSPALANLVGKDDGYAFSLMYGADVQGNLNDCGCPKHPQGGLAWRMGYVDGFKAVSPDAPAIQVDAGRIFATTVNVLQPYDRTRNNWVLKAYQQSGFAVANLSYYELPQLVELLVKPDVDVKKKEYPFIDKLVSANIKPARAEFSAPRPFLVETVTSKRAPKPIRLGFTGVTMADPNPGATPNIGYTVEDPIESLKKTLPELRKESDVVVVLVYGEADLVQKVAALEGIDIIISAHNNGAAMMNVQKLGNASVVSAFQQTKQLGDLRFYLTADGKIKELKNSLPILDKEIPKNPAAEKLATDAQTAIEESQKSAMNAPQVPAGPGSTPSVAPKSSGQK